MRSNQTLLAIALMGAGLSLGLSGCDRLRSVDTIVSRGEQQYEKANYLAALGDFKTALERDGNNLAARGYLARIYYHLADFEAAQEAVNIALDGAAPDADLHALKYQIMLVRRQYDQIIKAVDVEIHLSEAQRLLYFGQAKAEMGQSSEAMTAFERALTLAPNDPPTLVAQARLFTAMSDLPRASASIAAALKQDQDSAEAWLTHGALLMAKADLPAAKTALEQAVKLSPRQLNWSEQARLSAMLADIGLRMRNVDDTARWLASMESRAPKNPIIYYLKGRLALLKNNPNDALAQLQTAVQLGEYLPARLLLANVLMVQSSYGQAESQLDKLRVDYPDNIEVSKLLAQLYLATNRASEASKVLPAVDATGAGSDAQLDWVRGQTLLATGARDAGLSLLEKSVASNPSDANRVLQLARAHLAAGAADKALALLTGLPANAGGTQRQGLLVLASVIGKSKSDARRDMSALLARYPNDSVLHAAAASVYAQAGEISAANELFSKAVTLDGKNVDARLGLAALHFQAKRYDSAQAQLQAVLTQDAKNTRARTGLANIALAKGDKVQAAKELELAIGADLTAFESRIQLAQLAFADQNISRGLSLLEQAVSASNKEPAVLNSVGTVLFQAKQYDEALARYEQATAAGLAVARVNAARVNLALGQTLEAQRKLEVAANDRQTQVEAVSLLAQQEVRAGKLERAMQQVDRLSQNKVATQLVEELRGDTYALASQYPRAVDSYERATKLAPSQRLAIKTYRVRAAGKMPTPTAPLSNWLSTHPDDLVVRQLFAAQLAATGDRAGAVREFERYLASGGTREPELLNNLAWLYQQQNDVRAEAMAHEAYQAAPQVAAIADTYGWILLGAGKTTEALPILEKAATGAKGNFEIQYHLAAAHSKNGQNDRAKTLLREMLASNQAFYSRAEAERLLQNLGQ